MGYAWMVVPLLPVAAFAAIAVTFVETTISILPKLSNLSEPTTTPRAIEPILGGLLALYGFGLLVSFAVLFLGALSVYFLIDRRNRHFARQQLLFSALRRYLASKAPSSQSVLQLGFLSEDLAYEEKTRPAGLWAVLFLFFTPITCLIVSYNLTHDMRKHDELQSKYQAAVIPALVDAGFQQPALPGYSSRNRDPVLFIILTAITGGLFWIFWFYTLLLDYNEHFADQAKFEDQILSVLKPSVTQRPCGSCGGAVPPGARFCPSCGKQQAI
jgi:hypothetical protein